MTPYRKHKWRAVNTLDGTIPNPIQTVKIFLERGVAACKGAS
jgi:predicted methyltransferase